MKLAAGAATDTGLVRTNNEDSFLVDDEHVLYTIADGMGGHRGGEVASRTAIEALRAAIAGGQPVNDAIVQANTAVIDRAATDQDLEGMGTTMTAVVVAGGRQLLIGHVGDSRAYLLHDGTMRRITDDHSLVEELVRDGRLTPEQAESHPQRAIVTRALGVDSQVDVDLYTIEVEAGDRVLLCSDGLTTMVRDRDVERLARSETDPQRTAEVLVGAANRAGGEDNTSVVVIDVLEVDAATAPDPELLAAPAAARVPMAPAPDVEPPPAPAPGSPGIARPTCLGSRAPVRPADPGARHRHRRCRLVRAPVVLRRLREQPGRNLQGRARRRARLEPDDPAAHQAHRRPAHTGRPRPRRRRRRARLARRRQVVRRAPQCRRGRHLDHHHHNNHHDRAQGQTQDHRDEAAHDRDEAPLTMALAPIARQRRRSELSLGLLVVIIAVGGYILVALAKGPTLPPGLNALLAWVIGLYLVAHLAIRRFAPYADATLLPLAALLNGIGFVTIRGSTSVRTLTWHTCNHCGSRSGSACSCSR